MKKAIAFGIAASCMFATTFVLNRSMNVSGGHYLWSASLRYLFAFPLFFAVLHRKKETAAVYEDIKSNPRAWMLWSTVGFGVFYVFLSFASNFGESWLVAASWQITIVMGVLLTPLWGKPIPKKNLIMSCVILSGVVLLQFQNAHGIDIKQMFLILVPIIIAATAYPLGNRKMMVLCSGRLNTMQRIYGMIVCSLPVWITTAIAAFILSGPPSVSQMVQSAMVAIFCAFLGTIFFFRATNLVRDDMRKLAIVEATQSGEVVFTLIFGVLLLGDAPPSIRGIAGLVIIVGGMIVNSLISVSRKKEKAAE